VAYHKDFWVVVGTAAPVFIASIAAIFQGLSQGFTAERVWRSMLGYLSAFLALGSLAGEGIGSVGALGSLAQSAIKCSSALLQS
jgi:hypothetical protein